MFQSVFCGAQSNGYILDPLGNIYPCWERIGNPKALLGVYDEYGVRWNQVVCDEWHGNDITQHQSCRKCRYGLFVAEDVRRTIRMESLYFVVLIKDFLKVL